MKLLSYKDKELAGKRLYDLLHPDDLNYFASGHKECKSNFPCITYTVNEIVIIIIILQTVICRLADACKLLED